MDEQKKCSVRGCKWFTTLTCQQCGKYECWKHMHYHTKSDRRLCFHCWFKATESEASHASQVRAAH